MRTPHRPHRPHRHRRQCLRLALTPLFCSALCPVPVPCACALCRVQFGIENPEKIQFAETTKKFVADYLHHSANDSALFAAAFLSLGTEGIVSALYARLVDGMVKAGIPR